MSTVGPTKADYSVAWMCAFSFELKAAATMLDRTYESPLSAQNDPNIYIFGCIREHNVILTCLPPGQFGTSSSARTATILKSNFPSIQVVFLVGIGGGVPSSAHDIRLGDVVVSLPSGPHGGVVRYDFGKRREGVAIPIQYSRAPPSIVLSAIARLQITHMSYPERAGTFLSEALENNPQLQKWRDKAASDLLFHNDYVHERGSSSAGNRDQDHLIQRPQRMDTNPRVHFGTIASGNSVIMDGMTRDRISENLGGVLCFEMEAAGILNSLPCLVIRGISDYADSHKDKAWHEWAATAAAATAKEILSFIPAPGLKASHTVWDFTELHNAAKQEDEETVERLLQGGADVNGKDSEGNTPMHYAAMNGRKDIVSLLLAYNADDTITNSLGRSARDLATENGYPDVSAFLVDPPVTIKSTSKRREDREKIVQGAPSMEDRCNEACKAFDARVVLSFENKESLKLSKRWQIPIYDLLYSEDHDRWKEILEQWRSESQSKDQSAAHDALRWVHLPANNMLWVKDLIRRSDAEARCFASFTKAIPNGTVSQINIEEEIQLLQEIIRLLREIKDIRDELNMLSRVLHDQLDIMDKVSLWIGQEIPVHREWGIEARLTQIIRMDGDAERVEKSLNHLLDFKQKQSNIEEARLSRTQAEDTALQGKYLFVFTVVTVIFTPLSFMAALFAIQIKEFPQDDKGLSFDGRWIGKYMGKDSFVSDLVIR
ncbi:unnamed protein product [Alternaria alternata]